MRWAGFNATAGALLLFASTSPSAGRPFPLPGAKSAARYVDFRLDDVRGQRIAKRLLAKDIADDLRRVEPFRTAWVNVDDAKSPDLLVMYGCSPTGNCGLYGYERTKRAWRLVLNSIAQTCWILSSSHSGRRDISASMHGSATESTIKNYQWRENRYVRVSERNVTYK